MPVETTIYCSPLLQLRSYRVTYNIISIMVCRQSAVFVKLAEQTPHRPSPHSAYNHPIPPLERNDSFPGYQHVEPEFYSVSTKQLPEV